MLDKKLDNEKMKAITKLQGCLNALRSINARKTSDPSFKKWRRDTEIALEHIFGTKTRHLREFRIVNFNLSSNSMMDTESAFSKGKESAEALLQSMIEEVQEYWPELEKDKIALVKKTVSLSREVFIVHGHNVALRETVARFIQQLDLKPVILHEQPNKGRTIIEKFMDYSDARFAVVILTADDYGGEKNTPPDLLTPRARQNVILELGFFLGRLGRERVCTLYERGVEIPSDYDGVLFIPLDEEGAWKILLGREIIAAGLDVDLNKIT